MNLTATQVNKITKIFNDLKIKAMLFDMDIDWETATLVEKREDPTPQWIKNWTAKRRALDYNEYYDERG